MEWTIIENHFNPILEDEFSTELTEKEVGRISEIYHNTNYGSVLSFCYSHEIMPSDKVDNGMYVSDELKLVEKSNIPRKLWRE